MPAFGAHLSAAGGLHTVFDRAEEAACDCVQLFTKNKGAWAAKPLTEDDVKAFRSRAAASPVRPVVAHAAYLLNLASPFAELRERSTTALLVELERCEALGVPFLVLHPGSHAETSEEEGLRHVVACLNRVHARSRGFQSRILLETSAGQGSSVCSSFASLGWLLREARDGERLGVCLDTCHVHAAGYELRTAAGYRKTLVELEAEVGSSRVLCIHINDSKKELGSRVDRHEHLGEGDLGLEGLRRIVQDGRFDSVPFIFELPPEDDRVRRNLEVLRKLSVPRPRMGPRKRV